jgi:hypothetical protein
MKGLSGLTAGIAEGVYVALRIRKTTPRDLYQALEL